MERILIGRDSEVLIGRGLPAGMLPVSNTRTRAAIISQPGAARLAEQVAAAIEGEGCSAHLMVLPDGDAIKTLEIAGRTYEWLSELGIGRQDTIVGVGGGAVTDFAGFIAGTWLRGIEAIYVSTTLLGAVDAAIGGKTGLNLRGKNLVGLFRHPARVVIDIDVLNALPDELLSEGFAEAVKAGFIADPILVELIARDGLAADLEEVVSRAVAVKGEVVAGDFREAGRRGILNYGHTIGHGLEIAAGISHGRAVSIGMVAAGAVSEARLGFAGAMRQKDILAALGLPVVAPAVDVAEVRRLIGLDKKHDSAGLRMALLEDFGKVHLQHVTSDDITLGLAAIGLT